MKLTLIDKIIINKSDVLNMLNINDDVEIDLTVKEHDLILNYLTNPFDKISFETCNIISKIKYLLLSINKFINNYIIFGKYKNKLIENDIDLPKFTLFNKSIFKWYEIAAEFGNLECLKYAHENGCPWDN